MQTLLSIEFPLGERDELGATEQHRLLAHRLQATAAGRFWAAPRPACDITFTRGPIGWVAQAVPFVVHDHPALLALGETFTDGANLWIHGPWLQRQAAQVANDAQALVDWAHLALEDIARLAEDQQVTDPILPQVATQDVQRVLASLQASTQPLWNRWHTPGDASGVRQALQWAFWLDPDFSDLGLPKPLHAGGMPDMPAPTAWKAWSTLVAEHLPLDDGSPLLRLSQVSVEAVAAAQKLQTNYWGDRHTETPFLERLAQPLCQDGLLEPELLTILAIAFQALVLGSSGYTGSQFDPPLTSQRFCFGFDYKAILELDMSGLDSRMSELDSHELKGRVRVHPITHRPLKASTPGKEWRQACVWAALNEGVGLESAQAQGTFRSSPWLFELNAWQKVEEFAPPRLIPAQLCQLKALEQAVVQLMEVLAEAGLPMIQQPAWKTEDLVLESRPSQDVLSDYLTSALRFTGLMKAPLFARRSHQTPEAIIGGLASSQFSLFDTEETAEAYAFIQLQQRERGWNQTEHLERLCRSFVTCYTTHFSSPFLNKLEEKLEHQEKMGELLGVTSEHWLPAMILHANRLSKVGLTEMLVRATEDFFFRGFDPNQHRGVLGASIADHVKNHPEAPGLELLRACLRDHALNAVLPLPTRSLTPSRFRF